MGWRVQRRIGWRRGWAGGAEWAGAHKLGLQYRLGRAGLWFLWTVHAVLGVCGARWGRGGVGLSG
eukprot:scaffold52981_cov69-Phaeocystis_antarctica.AAC.2